MNLVIKVMSSQRNQTAFATIQLFGFKLIMCYLRLQLQIKIGPFLIFCNLSVGIMQLLNYIFTIKRSHWWWKPTSLSQSHTKQCNLKSLMSFFIVEVLFATGKHTGLETFCHRSMKVRRHMLSTQPDTNPQNGVNPDQTQNNLGFKLDCPENIFFSTRKKNLDRPECWIKLILCDCTG